MSQYEKFLKTLLRGASDGNIRYSELCSFLKKLGFDARQKGRSHHIFTKDGVEEIVNLQEREGGKAKPYQVRQVREILSKYNLQ